MKIIMLMGKGYVYFVDVKKAIDGVPKKVLELAMMNKGTSEVFVRSVMGLYDEAKR